MIGTWLIAFSGSFGGTVLALIVAAKMLKRRIHRAEVFLLPDDLGDPAGNEFTRAQRPEAHRSL